MSERPLTKDILGSTLMELCKTKDYEKISIVDITKTCGVNRQTFYYHFVDKSALLSWVYREKTFYGMGVTVSLDSWETEVEFMLKSISDYRYFYFNTVMSEPANFMMEVERITRQLILEIGQRMNVDSLSFAEDFRFYAELYAYGCNGILIDWIRSRLRRSISAIKDDLLRLARDVQTLMIIRLNSYE